MIAYIKRMADFRTAAKANVIAYTIPTHSANNDKGKIVLAGHYDGFVGDWLYFDGSLYLISGCTPETGQTTLNVVDPANAFSRSLIYSEGSYTTVGAFIAEGIAAQYAGCTDAAYRLPYISVSLSVPDVTGAFVPPQMGDNGIYSLADYILSVRLNGVWLDYTVSGDTLAIGISHRAPRTLQVYLGDGHSQLDKQTYSNSATAKVTIIQTPAEEGGTPTIADYYLSTDGTVSTTVPVQRAKGNWQTVSIGADDDPAAKAQEIFDANSFDHQITFYSDRQLDLYDKLRIFFPAEAKLFETSVTTVQIQSSDSRYYYKCGLLPATLTEQISQLKHSSSGASVSSGGGRITSGAEIYIGSDAPTDPSVLLWITP